MGGRLKVMTVAGTRPELIKLSRVIAELDKHTAHVLVHTGQNYDYELNEIFYDDLEIRKPNYFLGAAGATAAETIGNVISKIDPVLNHEKPDAIVIYGDTNSCLAAIAAKRRRIPVFHMEAGNRCFDERVPEEINRRIIDHISDINLTLTDHARRYLMAEGIRPETIIKCGSCMPEILAFCQSKIDSSDVLQRLGLEKSQYFVVSAHREENVDSQVNLSDLLHSLNTIAECYDVPIVFSTHPRTKKRLDEVGTDHLHQRIQFLKPLGFSEYVKLQMHALCVISDSGTITEEASILNLPAITIRQAHERLEGMDEGTLIMSGLKPERILQSIAVVISQHDAQKRTITPVLDYQAQRLSYKVIRIILSYTDYIRRCVWRDAV